jgi:hypothetical protein
MTYILHVYYGIYILFIFPCFKYCPQILENNQQGTREEKYNLN